jgi:hypothetical protein
MIGVRHEGGDQDERNYKIQFAQRHRFPLTTRDRISLRQFTFPSTNYSERPSDPRRKNSNRDISRRRVVSQFEVHLLSTCRVEHALRRAYCSLNPTRALAPEVTQPLPQRLKPRHSVDVGCTPQGVLHPRSLEQNFHAETLAGAGRGRRAEPSAYILFNRDYAYPF